MNTIQKKLMRKGQKKLLGKFLSGVRRREMDFKRLNFGDTQSITTIKNNDLRDIIERIKNIYNN